MILYLFAIFAAPQIVATHSLSPIALNKINPLLKQTPESALKLGLPVFDQPGIGSGLRLVAGNKYLSVTDRGPNGDFGQDKFFPVPTFSPTIVETSVNKEIWSVTNSIYLRDSMSRPISGLPNGPEDGIPVSDSKGLVPLQFDPNGVDTEDIQKFSNGNFLLVEEYSPSILLVNPSGQILMRFLPEGKKLNTTYPTLDLLPKILLQRNKNKGLECLALAPNNKAWAIMQAPIGKDKNSNVVRAIRLDFSNQLKPKITGMFVITFSDPHVFSSESKVSDLSFSAAEWLQDETILLLERCNKGFRIHKVDFSKASNLLGTRFESSTELESKLGTIIPAKKELLLESKSVPAIDQMKIEGITATNPQSIAIISDNDFGIDKPIPTKLWNIKLPFKLADPKPGDGASGGTRP